MTVAEEIATWSAKPGAITDELRVDHQNPEATFWVQATPGVTYARATLPARYLPGKLCALTSFDLVEGFDGEPSFPRQQGAAIWSFAANTTKALMMAGMQERGFPVFWECDDLYTVPSATPGLTEWKITPDHPDDSSYWFVKRIVPWVDGVICSTDFLAAQMERYNPNVNVCRNCVDPDDWDEPLPRDDVLRFGWAASPSHLHDAALIERALSWLSDQPNVEVVLIGIDPQYRFKYTHVPWSQSLAGYRENLRQAKIDVMLCPLKDTLWTNCKSDLKALEAAMSGGMSIVSPVPAYDLWQDRTFVCHTSKDWLRTVRHLCNNKDEVYDLQQKHRRYVLDERSIKVGVEQWRRALSTVTNSAGLVAPSSQ